MQQQMRGSGGFRYIGNNMEVVPNNKWEMEKIRQVHREKMVQTAPTNMGAKAQRRGQKCPIKRSEVNQ